MSGRGGAGPTRLTYELIRLPDRRFTFEGDLLHADGSTLVVSSRIMPSRPLLVGGEEVIGEDYRAIWFLFNGRPWDVGRMYRPDGTFTGYYADVLEPVSWQREDPATLQPLVDLFLDVWIGREGDVLPLDEDELEQAQAVGAIDEARAAQARSVLKELVTAARAGTFPPQIVREFDGGD